MTATTKDSLLRRSLPALEVTFIIAVTALALIPFIWLALPDPWLSGTFKKAAQESGVLIDDEDEFKAGQSEKVFHRVRCGISQPRQREQVEAGVDAIRRLLEEGRAGYESFG